MSSEQALSAPAVSKGIAGGLLLATLGAVAFSGKAIIVKLGYRYGADAVLLLMLRMLFALPLFLAMAWWAGRGKPPLSRRDWWGVVGLGFCGYYLSSYLDFAVQFKNKKPSEQQRELVEASKAHFGDDWIVLPNAAYGAWSKATLDSWNASLKK